jgi:hypothetical protein
LPFQSLRHSTAPVDPGHRASAGPAGPLGPGRPFRGSPARLRLTFLAAATAAVTLVAIGTPAQAAGFIPEGSGSGWSSTGLADTPKGPGPDALMSAVRALDPYVRRTRSGTFRIDAPPSVVAAIPSEVLAKIQNSSRLVNLDIAAGRLLSLPDGRVLLAKAPTAATSAGAVAADGQAAAGRALVRKGSSHTTSAGTASVARSTSPVVAGQSQQAVPDAAPPAPAAPAAPPAPAVSGNTIKVNWWGVAIHLDEASANQLIGALAGASTVAAIVSVLVGAGVVSTAAVVPLAIITGVLAIVTGALQACLTPQGLDLSITWIGFGWCTKPLQA